MKRSQKTRSWYCPSVLEVLAWWGPCGAPGCGCGCMTLLRGGARYSNMDWVCWESIFARSQGMGSVQKKSWLRALSLSYRLVGSRCSSRSSRSRAYGSFT
uniref:Uncharacterized protein n=1 Tax=Ixodes ricinus TaxID=34613 RepID=A0A6B0UI92_IXORI